MKTVVFQAFAALLLAIVLSLHAEKVRVGFYLEDGFCGFDAKGERTGVCVDWAAAVAPINGWDVEWVNCSWSGGLKRLEKGEVDMMVAAVYRGSRRERWLFPHIPLAPFRTYLFVREGSPLANNTRTLEGARIGVPAEYVHADILRVWLEQKDISCSIKVYQSVPELERALDDGTLDAALGAATRSFMKHKAYVALPALPLYVAVNPRRPDLAEACDRAATILNELDPDFIRRITRKHFAWQKEILPLHDISRDRDLSDAVSTVLAEGASFAVEGHGTTQKSESGQDVGPFVIAIILLASAGVLGYIRLMRALAAARTAARAKANFLATMSHEIRTPLNAVVGFTELLDDPRLDSAARREYLDGIKFASGALVSLIDDVLDLSKLEAERMDVLNGSVDPVRLVSELESVFSFRTAEKGVALQCSAAKGVPCLALRESCVRQMLLNLIGNAVKFTDEGAIHCRIAAVQDGKDTVTFLAVVRDTGCGIPAEKLATLFDPFVQASDSSRDRVYKGTGLGLAIVKRLVEAARGTLEVRSEVGRGTAFAVRIPHVKTLGPSSILSVVEPPKIGRELPPLFEQLSFLLVDDVPINLKVLQLHLRNLGCEDVRTAESGAEALHLLKLRPAHIVLTDLWMPEMTGEQLVRAIRKDPDLAGMKTVVITADADAGATFDQTAFDALTTKPITTAKLKAVISKFLMPHSQN